jgi:hypothetical protein
MTPSWEGRSPPFFDRLPAKDSATVFGKASPQVSGRDSPTVSGKAFAPVFGRVSPMVNGRASGKVSLPLSDRAIGRVFPDDSGKAFALFSAKASAKVNGQASGKALPQASGRLFALLSDLDSATFWGQLDLRPRTPILLLQWARVHRSKSATWWSGSTGTTRLALSEVEGSSCPLTTRKNYSASPI